MTRPIIPELPMPDIFAFFTGKTHGGDAGEISTLLKIGIEDIYLPIQKHTDAIHVLGSDRERVVADAVVTQEEGLLIGVQVADCVPVLLWDAQKRVIAAVHAGWRGVAHRIVAKTIAVMAARFGCAPGTMFAAIGPSIRGCSYEVDRDVSDSVRAATGEGEYFLQKGEKFFVDLAKANRLQAFSAGIPYSAIWSSPDCTFCNPGKYYSYRFSKGSAGRQGGFIGIGVPGAS